MRSRQFEFLPLRGATTTRTPPPENIASVRVGGAYGGVREGSGLPKEERKKAVQTGRNRCKPVQGGANRSKRSRSPLHAVCAGLALAEGHRAPSAGAGKRPSPSTRR
eukprot:12064561-Alexandrium_andersonii.AAC.1